MWTWDLSSFSISYCACTMPLQEACWWLLWHISLASVTAPAFGAIIEFKMGDTGTVLPWVTPLPDRVPHGRELCVGSMDTLDKSVILTPGATLWDSSYHLEQLTNWNLRIVYFLEFFIKCFWTVSDCGWLTAWTGKPWISRGLPLLLLWLGVVVGL